MSERGKLPEPSCPICGKAQVARYRPFCSKRCADIDLNRWLTGRYAIPAASEEHEQGGKAEGGAEGATDGDREDG